MDTLFHLVRKESGQMTWLLCFIGEKLPQLILPRMHHYLILGLATHTNPFLNATDTIRDEQSSIIHMGDKVFTHLLSSHKSLVIDSLLSLVEDYFRWIDEEQSFVTEVQQYMLGYLLSLPKISPSLFNESWSSLFQRLYKGNAAGSMFLYEKKNESSVVKHGDGTVESIASVFPFWLTSIAFDSNGLVMKHAMDVAIMLDTLGHDERLGLEYLIPTGDKSILDTLRPSLEKLDLKPTSIDLIDWAISSMKIGRGVNDLKIPLFLLQLVVLKNGVPEKQVVDMFVQFIIRLDRPQEDDETCNEGARYLILNLVSSTQRQWPTIFQSVLENIFSRAIAMHIADSEGSVNVEKILSNLAMLFQPDSSQRPGFDAFKTYLSSHWRQVLLLFLNHPSMECRAVGYRVLTNSRFWENTNKVEGCDAQTISKLLVDAWFRHIKGRYVRYGQQEEISAINEQQRLIAHCCQHTELAKAMLSFAMDGILGGALEIFPTIDVNALQQEKKSLYDKVVREEYQPPLFKKPPQFVTTLDFQQEEGGGLIDVRDVIYVDNIERTAALFFQFGELPTLSAEQYLEINRHILHRLSSIWGPNPVSLDTYDDVLPRNIPYASDIAIGNAFKDHPVLFIIFEKYTYDQTTATKDYPVTNDIIRSILVYFIVFWNMKEVVSVPTTLKFATQLEETTRLLFLLKPVLPEFLVNAYHVLPFMSAKEVGDILYQVIWYYLRWSSSNANHIPGIHKKLTTETNHDELKEKCLKRLLGICEGRLKVLDHSPLWHASLSSIMSQFFHL
ncbi:uncharacterized protein EV154DRAFT_507174 [Mucor mucedo]|uniref:uncharacterized protein n=1 Tax=Mucor mucedo TaxID=29922 RepID=UPI00221F4A72|nr:uncharacterized protein EV154DRAFT_507174 [Mucor mucedo]KAI7891780.1 hypothetical protein EV154DRAFT_507174 [Mucor mucedo]